MPTCTFCSDNAARPGLLWPVERRATVIAIVMGERPSWPRAACRNDMESLEPPPMTDVIESVIGPFFGLEFGRLVRLTTPAAIVALSIA